MILTKETYHSLAAKQIYMSASRYKTWCGSLGIIGCEARAMAELKGEWVEEQTPAMKVSSFIDAHFAGTLDIFTAQNRDICNKDGSLKAAYEHNLDIIERMEADPYFMQYMSGDKQVIMTAELFGMPWSIMIDSFIKDVAIVDLKVMADLRKSFWVKDSGHMSFVPYYGYWEQAALYQEVVFRVTGKRLPFYIAAASKEEYPDLEIIGFTQGDLDDIMTVIERNMVRVKMVRNSEDEPDRCGQCSYCRSTKKLSRPVHYSELLLNV
jgi:hypothetical protein